MSDRQLSYIKDLIDKKDWTGREDAKWRLLKTLNNAADPEEPDLSHAQASQIIDWINSHLPWAEAKAPTALPNVPKGRYAIDRPEGCPSSIAPNQNVLFLIVDRPTEGKWAGYTFVNWAASDNRTPIRDKDARRLLLAAIEEADPITAMRRYGQTIGHCGACGKALTDEASILQGIGPDCRKQRGL